MRGPLRGLRAGRRSGVRRAWWPVRRPCSPRGRSSRRSAATAQSWRHRPAHAKRPRPRPMRYPPQMRAIVFPRPGAYELIERPDPRPGPREVVVRVEAVGLCGTDLHVLDGEFAPTVYPIVPGHETTGIVHQVGDQVSHIGARRPGRRRSVALLRRLPLLHRRPAQPVRQLERRRGRPDRRIDRRPGLLPRRKRAQAARFGGPAARRSDRAVGLRHPRLRPVAPADGRALSGLRGGHHGPDDGPARPPRRRRVGDRRRPQPRPADRGARGRGRAGGGDAGRRRPPGAAGTW